MMTENKKIKSLHFKLLNKDENYFTQKGTKVKVSKKEGVYIIYSPKNVVLHVGVSTNLDRRLNQHRYGNSSFSNKYLKPQGLKTNADYKFKFIEIRNARTRVLLEALTAGKLCPEYIGDGKKDM